MKGRFLIYSLVAAAVIASCSFFIGVQFAIGYSNLIVASTFFFAFFTYSIDHYLDSQNAETSVQLHSRHQVGVKSYKFALKGLALTALTTVYFFYFLPGVYILTGLVLGALSMVYFVLVFKVKISKGMKQLCSALILTLVMGSWIFISNHDRIQTVLYLIILFCAVLSNLLTFGYLDTSYDKELEKSTNQRSIGRKKLILVLILFTVFIFLLGFFNGVGQTWLLVPLTYLMMLTLVPSGAWQKSLARIVLDLAMLLPMVKLLL